MHIILNVENFGFTTAVALQATVFIIWTAISTVVILALRLRLAKAKVKVQNKLKLVNQTPTTFKATSSSCKEIPMEISENVAYAKYIH